MKGKVLAGYSLMEQIDENDHESVYLATARDGDGLVIVHVLAPGANNAEGMQRLRNIRQIQSPQILSIIDCGEAPWGPLYYVEPCHEGVNLNIFIDSSGPILWVSAAVLLYQISRGIAHAHGKGVAHGGLSGERVLLDPGGHVRVQGVGIPALYQGGGLGDVPIAQAFNSDIRAMGRIASLMIGADQQGSVEIPSQYRQLCALQETEGSNAVAVEASLTRMLQEAGVTNPGNKLEEFFEEWSFFFLLNKTFTRTADGDTGRKSGEDSGSVELIPSDQPATGLDVGFFGEPESPKNASEESPEESPEKSFDGSSESWSLQGDTVQELSSDSMELEREKTNLAAFTPPKAISEESEANHKALEKLKALHISNVEKRHRTLQILMIVGAIILGVVIARMVTESPSESELDERAREELSKELGDKKRPRFRTGEPTPAELAQRELDELVHSIQSELKEGRVSSARERLSSVDEDTLNEEALIVVQVNVLRAEKKSVEAEALLVGVWEENRKSALLIAALIALYQREQRWDDALQLVTSSDSIGVDSPLFFEAAATLYKEMGDRKEELRMLKRVVETDSDPLKLFRVGLLEEHFRHYAEAATLYRSIVMDFEGGPEEAFWGLLRVTEKTGFDRRGLLEVEKILAKKPGHVPSQIYLAERHFTRAENALAARYLKLFESSRPQSWKAKFLQAGLMLREGKVSEAIVLYKALRLVRPGDGMISHNLAIAYRIRGNLSDAKAAFEVAIGLDADLWQSSCELAQIHHRARRYQEAKRLYKQAYKTYKRHPWIREIVPLKLDSPKAGYLLTEACFSPEIVENSRYEVNRKSVLVRSTR